MKKGTCELCRRDGVEVSLYGLCAGQDLSGCRHSLRWQVNVVNRLLERHKEFLDNLPSRIGSLEQEIKELKSEKGKD